MVQKDKIVRNGNNISQCYKNDSNNEIYNSREKDVVTFKRLYINKPEVRLTQQRVFRSLYAVNNQEHSNDNQPNNNTDQDMDRHNETDSNDDKKDTSVFDNESNIVATRNDVSPNNVDHNVLTVKVNKMEGSLEDMKEMVHTLVDVIKISIQF